MQEMSVKAAMQEMSVKAYLGNESHPRQSLTFTGKGEVSCAYLHESKYIPVLGTVAFHST